MQLTDYVTLGRSGLRVSPICLGTMTFGTESGWGAEEADARAIFDCYLDQGGNFFDCANNYAKGTSERMLGSFIKASGVRDRAVVATKFTRCIEPSNPNAVGNGRKAMRLSLEQSLKRLQTDHIDLYWMHSWDGVTPVEEVLDSLNDLVREGKIRYFGLSDVPAWYATRFQTLAEIGDRKRCIALQLEYSLVERSIEREHVPALRELGMALCAWSPLASGFLAGKYRRASDNVDGIGRLKSDAGIFNRFVESNWRVLEQLDNVAAALDRSPAQVAINWVLTQPGSTSPIIGARSVDQLRDNLGALDVIIPQNLRDDLDQVSRLPAIHPYLIFEPPMSELLGGGVSVRAWTP